MLELRITRTQGGRNVTVSGHVQELEPRVLMAAQFISRSVAFNAVIMEGANFNLAVQIKNTDSFTWSGYKLVRIAGSDPLGGRADVVPLSTIAPGGTAYLNIPLTALKASGGSKGANQLIGWELRNAGGGFIPLTNLPATHQQKLWAPITITPNVYGPGIPRLNHTGYTTANPYVSEGNGGQCTAYAWGRANEVMGRVLAKGGNAGDAWFNTLKNSGLATGSTPRVNSLIMWRLGTSTTSGHVAYVENVYVQNGVTYITITEANWASNGSWASRNHPNGGGNYGGGYDGARVTLTQSQMETRGSYNLVGYVYL